jgi:hypothetical protein
LTVFLDLVSQPAQASGAMRPRLRFAVLLLPVAVAACGGGGTRVSYRPPAARNYAEPGPPSDPWGPYVREAAGRFAIPETFIRAVMRQESGGHEYLNGELITSRAGAMGLMQVMPATYATLAQRNGLGPDPYDPHDNILAGAALIKELFDKYGSPAFLAAYDAGPRRLDDYLAGNGELPNETVAYLDNVAPRLVGAAPMSGPLVAFAGTAAPAPSPVPQQAPVEVAEAGQPTQPGTRLWGAQAAAPSPTPQPAPRPAPRPAPSRFALIPSAYADTLTPSPTDARWGVQVGAFADPGQAHQAAETARGIARAQLNPARTVVGATTHPDGHTFYRARLIGITEPAADRACGVLTARSWACLAVPPGG